MMKLLVLFLVILGTAQLGWAAPGEVPYHKPVDSEVYVYAGAEPQIELCSRLEKYYFPIVKVPCADANLLLVLRAIYGEHLFGLSLPRDYRDLAIAGKGEVTLKQAQAFIELNNSRPSLACSAREITELYFEEASSEGIKWDIALCQAILETGFFGYGGTVVPQQNNYCGLGTTSATVRGAYFLTPRLGVRAHIQHLLAYTRKQKPRTELVDPRYHLVYDNKLREGFFTSWYQLNGKWATGDEYCEKILNLHENMKKVVVAGDAKK